MVAPVEEKKTLELVHMNVQPEYGDRDENELWKKECQNATGIPPGHENNWNIHNS